jgi:cyclin-dependent kinase
VIDEAQARHSVAPVIDSPEVNPNYEEEQFQEDAITIGKYQHCHHHDDGLLSTIYRAKNDDGELVALKVTTPHLMGPPHDSKREVRLLKETASKHVIPLFEAFDLAGGRLILVFPYMQFNLNELLQEDILTPSQVKSHLRDMFTALEFVHGLGIIHRDVKPSNILLKSPAGPAYLSDFGIAWKDGDAGSEPSTQKITDVGTTSYRPPEILFGSKDYNTTLDLWAAGCVVAEILDVYHSQLFDAGPLGSELALIQSIFTTLGTPDITVWPVVIIHLQAKKVPVLTSP